MTSKIGSDFHNFVRSNLGNCDDTLFVNCLLYVKLYFFKKKKKNHL